MNQCIFCHEITNEQIIVETKLFKVVFDIDPIQTGHLLIISKRHCMNITDLTMDECMELMQLQQNLTKILERFSTGVTIVSNNGKVMDPNTHYHVHIIPRYASDGFWSEVEVKEQSIDKNTLIEAIRNM